MTTPYGITWSDENESLAQTGYVYATVEEAEAVARKVLLSGDYDDAETQVDSMTESDAKPLYANVETTDDTVKTISYTEVAS